MNFRVFLKVLFLFSFVLSCKKIEPSGSVKFVGHAISGLGTFNQLFASNSEKGLQFALSFENLDAIEVDIQFSKDSTFVCFHDEFLEINTTGSGNVYERNSQDVLEINYSLFPNQKIMSYEKFCSYDLSEKEVFLDLKFDQPYLEGEQDWYRAKLYEAIDQLNCQRVSVFHENRDFLSTIIYPDVDRYVHIVNYDESLTWLQNYSFEGVISRNNVIDVSDWNDIVDAGYKTVIFDVKSSAAFESTFDKNPDYIIVEDIVQALEYK